MRAVVAEDGFVIPVDEERTLVPGRHEAGFNVCLRKRLAVGADDPEFGPVFEIAAFGHVADGVAAFLAHLDLRSDTLTRRGGDADLAAPRLVVPPLESLEVVGYRRKRIRH